MVYDVFVRAPRREVLDIRHLSPVREESGRIAILSHPPEDDVGHRGEFAMPHLYRVLNAGGRKSDFIQKHIRSIANVDALEFKAKARSFESHFLGRNMDTNAMCFLADFGFGVSQCVPILVQGALH